MGKADRAINAVKSTGVGYSLWCIAITDLCRGQGNCNVDGIVGEACDPWWRLTEVLCKSGRKITPSVGFWAWIPATYKCLVAANVWEFPAACTDQSDTRSV